MCGNILERYRKHQESAISAEMLRFLLAIPRTFGIIYATTKSDRRQKEKREEANLLKTIQMTHLKLTRQDLLPCLSITAKPFGLSKPTNLLPQKQSV